jgi:hypothetical protein
MGYSPSNVTSTLRKSRDSPPVLEPEGSLLVHERQPSVPVLSQMNPAHILQLFPKHPFSYSVFRVVSFLRLPTNILCLFLISPMRTSCPTHLILIDCIVLILIWWKVQIMELLIMQFSPVSYHFIPLRLNILFNTLLSNTPNLCSSVDVRNSYTPIQNRLNYSFIYFNL